MPPYTMVMTQNKEIFLHNYRKYFTLKNFRPEILETSCWFVRLAYCKDENGRDQLLKAGLLFIDDRGLKKEVSVHGFFRPSFLKTATVEDCFRMLNPLYRINYILTPLSYVSNPAIFRFLVRFLACIRYDIIKFMWEGLHWPTINKLYYELSEEEKKRIVFRTSAFSSSSVVQNQEELDQEPHV